MTIEELQQCIGFRVSVSLNGETVFAKLEPSPSADGSLLLSCPAPTDKKWREVSALRITDEIAANMQRSSGNTLSSTICLVSDKPNL